MSTKFFNLILLILVSVSFCFSQQTYEEKQRRAEEDGEREKVFLEQLKSWQAPEFAGFVESFLPAENDSWTISISRSGGFLGASVKLIGLVNSQGKVACSDADQVLPDDSLADLAAFVLTNNFKNLRKTFKPEQSFCRDCYVTTLTLNYRRKKDKTTAYQYSWISLPQSSPEIKQFYEKAKSYTACQ